MKKFTKLFLMSFMAAGLFSCSNDNEPVSPDQPVNPSGERIYMQFQLDMPSASRSATDDAGNSNSNAKEDTEVGQDAENKVTDIQLLLVDAATDKIIAKSADGFTQKGTMCLVPFQSASLEALAKKGEGTNVNVIAFCNYHAGATSVKAESYRDAKFALGGDGTTAAIWANNHFMMTNANTAVCKLPALEQLKQCTKEETAWNIGKISVERTAARFDFSPKTDGDYAVPDAGVNINVRLTHMAMFNISKECYDLRRVSANGKGAGELFGKELPWALSGSAYTGGNYVVDTDAANKVATNFLDNEEKDLDWTVISTLDQADSWKGNDKGNNAYYIWRYATENTIPAGVSQKQNIATGVSFKGEIVATASEDPIATEIAATINAHTEPVYVLNGQLCGSWNTMEKLALSANDEGVLTNEALNGAYKVAKEILGQGSDKVAAAKSAGFSVYEPTGDKYLVYYNYYNRHNNNAGNVEEGKDANEVTAPMEFAVVRNNVYKLKVDKINKLGTPNWEKPGDIDIETEDVFFQVSVEILPWTVRVNNIEL